MKFIMFMKPCIPQSRPLLRSPLPPLQIMTVCTLGNPMNYAQPHNPTTLLMNHHDKLPLSLRRHLHLFAETAPFYLPFASPLWRSRRLILHNYLIHMNSHRSPQSDLPALHTSVP